MAVESLSEAQPFVHLHTHTEYSLLDGATRISELVENVKAMGQPAVALTDHGALYGAVEFYAAATAAGVKPIIGCETYVAPRSHRDKEARTDRDPSHLVLLARDETGYRNLISLVTTAHLEGFYYKPRIDKQLLAERAAGLICLSACLGGELPQALLNSGVDAAERVAREHMEIFGVDNYALELQDHGLPEEERVREGLLEVARRTGLPLVCTNDAHYSRPEDAEAHDILLCLQTGARQETEKRFRFAGTDFFLSSAERMRERFASYPDAVSNTVALAARCQLTLQLGRQLLPTYSPIPDGLDADSYLREVCEKGLRERYGDEPSKEARERLAMELEVIRETGFSAYFLIVWDLVRAGRCDGVKVGPGRGSAAGSLVSYVLRITNICPLRHELIFERFLNRERLQMPDIDIDFDDRRRDRVLQYVQEKYGKDRVAQIITFGTMAARAAIRDVGRVLDIPLPDVDRLAKLVPPGPGVTLERALRDTRELREMYEGHDWVRRVIDNARRLEGIARNASTHAAGVVIAPEPLHTLTPLQRSTKDSDAIITQFDMTGVQKIGLLKIDLLGLTNLTVIDETLQNIRAVRGLELDIDDIPLDDERAYALLGRADTHGVFQMEAVGAKRILLDMQPASLEDLAVANALNRPGPIEGGVIDLFLKRMRGEEPVTYMLPQLEPILRESYGIIVYQDQVMQIAVAVAGYSMAEADVLRAAMGKKDREKMAQQREKFLAGATERGIRAEKAAELFDLMAFFAGYGFNKAHAVAYGLISYQTAYLKANYPLEYLAALLNSRAGDFDKLKETILDCHGHGLIVRPPDINRSAAGFTVGDAAAGEILYGLCHIKNVGEKVIETILSARETHGPYRTLLDLCVRAGGRDLNRRVLEALIRSGACDPLGERSLLLALVDRALDRAAQIKQERESGQTSLFGEAWSGGGEGVSSGTIGHEEFPIPSDLTPASEDERLAWERELLGMYLSDHPLRRLDGVLRERCDTSVGELGLHLDGLLVQIGGAVRSMRAFVPRRSTTGQRMAFLQIEDMTGACEVIVWPRIFEECSAVLRPDAVVVIRGRVEAASRSGGNGSSGSAQTDEEEAGEAEPCKVLAEAVYSLDDPALEGWRRNTTLHLTVRQKHPAVAMQLRQAMEHHTGSSPVVLHLEDDGRVDDIELSNEYRVDPGPALERAVEAVLGEGTYRLEVRRDRAPDRDRVRPRR